MSDTVKDGFEGPQPIAIGPAGVSLRDHFASMAMQAFAGITGDEELTLEGVANAAYAQADAMLEAREPKLAGEPSLVDELVAIKEKIILARRDGASDPKGNGFNYGLQVADSIISESINSRAGEAS